MPKQSDIVKIWAKEPDSESAEGFWARPLGDSLYEIQNIVMFVPGLHPLDVVRCKEEDGMRPEVVEVVRSSGWRTMHVLFREDAGATKDNFVDVVWALRQKGCPSEKAGALSFAFAIPSEADYHEILKYMQDQEDQGILYFEDLDEDLK